MNAFVRILSDLDFQYWCDENLFHSDGGENSSNATLNSSMAGALTLVTRQGYLSDFKFREPPEVKIAELVQGINSNIEDFDSEEPDFEQLGDIFDLIQVWGGITCRAPYVRSNSRADFDNWKHIYLLGAKQAQSGRAAGALNAWVQIGGIGMSFATKHLKFWNDECPILDTRISLLLCGTNRMALKLEGYSEFLKIMDALAKCFDTTVAETEKALFAFSKNYFMNDALVFDASYDNSVNFDIAKRLSELPPAPKIK